MSTESKENIAVILVEPQSPGNIGMVCRAMANFGASDLRLVNPCEHLHPEARKFAVGANPLLGSAKIFPDLGSAISDLQITVAATRRQGKLRGKPMDVTEAPTLLKELAAERKLGIVFGREDAGLTTAEVAACSHAAAIATSAECGSINLAQAVLLFLYEFGRSAAAPSEPVEENPPSQGEMEELFRQMEGVLSRIAFLNPARPEQAMNPLRHLFHRVGLSRAELNLLRGVWTQLAWSIRDWKGRKRGED